MNIKDLLALGRAGLKEAAIENPGFEAELLLSKVLDCDRIFFYTHSQENVSKESEDWYINFVKRRCANEPMAYILEEKEFMGLSFFVNDKVLIPRPDTEPMVEYLLDFLGENYKEGAKIFDLCTGSGAIGISLKKYFKQGEVTLGDISEDALEITKINSETLVRGEVQLILGDLFQGVPKEQKFDLIVSNPPYIKKEDLKGLSKDILNYEPSLALDGGDSGLDFYERITCDAKDYLNEKGILALEIGDEQEALVKKLLSIHGYKKIIGIKDLTGKTRSLIGEIEKVL